MIWRIKLLGGLSISRGSHVITHFESSRVSAMLAYLALNSNRTTSREELVDILWPDEEIEVGKHRLRQALYSLRRQLEPTGIPANSVLAATRSTVCLNPESFSCDVLEFQSLVRTKQFRQAKELYQGELLPGLYDEWILEERNRLQEIFEQIPDDLPDPRINLPEPKVQSHNFVSLPGYLTTYFGPETSAPKININKANANELRKALGISAARGEPKSRLHLIEYEDRAQLVA